MTVSFGKISAPSIAAASRIGKSSPAPKPTRVSPNLSCVHWSPSFWVLGEPSFVVNCKPLDEFFVASPPRAWRVGRFFVSSRTELDSYLANTGGAKNGGRPPHPFQFPFPSDDVWNGPSRTQSVPPAGSNEGPPEPDPTPTPESAPKQPNAVWANSFGAAVAVATPTASERVSPATAVIVDEKCQS